VQELAGANLDKVASRETINPLPEMSPEELAAQVAAYAAFQNQGATPMNASINYAQEAPAPQLSQQ
jgi:hypothetical protein